MNEINLTNAGLIRLETKSGKAIKAYELLPNGKFALRVKGVKAEDNTGFYRRDRRVMGHIRLEYFRNPEAFQVRVYEVPMNGGDVYKAPSHSKTCAKMWGERNPALAPAA
jgi:hypothetical protein